FGERNILDDPSEARRHTRIMRRSVKINRRNLLSGVAGCLAGSILARGVTKSVPAANAKPPSTLQEQLAERARESRLSVNFDGRGFSGAGWDRLISEGAAAQFFLLGEEH